jgi:hypothetical protein
MPGWPGDDGSSAWMNPFAADCAVAGDFDFAPAALAKPSTTSATTTALATRAFTVSPEPPSIE